MCANLNADKVSTAATEILKIWIPNPEYKLKDLTLKQYQDDQAVLTKVLKDIKEKEDALTPLINQRNDLAKKINANTTRVRKGIAGYFGEDSSEYEIAGGTRTSERKKGGRKKTVVVAAK